MTNKVMIKQIKIDEPFEILDKNGNYLELGHLYLRENFKIGSQTIEDYSLLIKLIGHTNKFTPKEIHKWLIIQREKMDLDRKKNTNISNEVKHEK